MKRFVVALPAMVLVLSGCYHTQVTTGKRASSTVVEVPWAKSFINGLVPPDELNVEEECPNGVAKVETQLSFLNMVAHAVTFGIFSPMHLKVTCAEDGMAQDARADIQPVSDDLSAADASVVDGEPFVETTEEAPID